MLEIYGFNADVSLVVLPSYSLASPLRKSAPGSLLKPSGSDLRTSSSRGLAASFEAGRK